MNELFISNVGFDRTLHALNTLKQMPHFSFLGLQVPA